MMEPHYYCDNAKSHDSQDCVADLFLIIRSNKRTVLIIHLAVWHRC